MTHDLEQNPLAGTIATRRYPAVRWRAGSDWGEIFEAGVDYTGLTLTIEIADHADAMALLAALALPGSLTVTEPPPLHPRGLDGGGAG
jgi:hypothetical protein